MTSPELALAIIAARKWRNGHLIELDLKGLRDQPIDRELDSDCTPEQWERLNNDSTIR